MGGGEWVVTDEGIMVGETCHVEITEQRFRQLSVDGTFSQDRVYGKFISNDQVSYRTHARALASRINDSNNIEDGYLTDVSEEYAVVRGHTNGNLFSASSSEQLASWLSSKGGGRNQPVTPAESVNEETMVFGIDTLLRNGVLSDSGSGTDFQEIQESPCVRQKKRLSLHRSNRPRTSSRPECDTAIRRRSKPSTCVISRKPKVFPKSLTSTPKSSGSTSLVNLSAKSPLNHRWTQQEHIILCLLYRFYDGPNATETYPIIFNSITGLGLRSRVIRSRFENYLCLFGRKAFKEFKAVFETSFRCHITFRRVHKLIESTIEALGIDLHRRDRETIFREGWGCKAKSPRTRSHYRELVRRASRQEEANTWHPQQFTSEQLPVSDDIIDDVEAREGRYDRPPLIPFATVKSPSNHRRSLPTLAFRVWDADSRGTYNEVEGFVSQDFVGWTGPHLKPPPVDRDADALFHQMVKHLDKKGGSSPWISTTTSLLHALKIAAQKLRPRIAIINMEHVSFRQQNKVHHGAGIVRWLKDNGAADFPYKGSSELVIFFDICQDAVIHQFSLADLVALSEKDPGCKKLMNLDFFKAGKSASSIASKLQNQKTILDITAAESLASIVKLFRAHTFSLAALQAFVGCLINGFYLHAAENHDEDILAFSFMKKLGSQIHSRDDVMAAFINGIDEGFQSIAHYSKRY